MTWVFFVASASACGAFGVENPAEPNPAVGGEHDAGLVDGGAGLLADGAPSGRWCDEHDAAFCSDFDVDPFAAGWSEPTITGGGQLSADSTLYRSAPRALSAVATHSNNGEGRARLCRGFARTSEIHVAFDVRTDMVDSTSETAFLSVRGPAGAQSVYLEVVAHTGTWEMAWLATGGDVLSHRVQLTAQPDDGKWARMKLDVTTSPADGGTADHLVVQLGSGVVGDSSFTLPALDGVVEVCIGVMDAVDVSNAWQFHFDNVLVDMHPVD